MADRWRCLLVAGIATALLALPPAAVAKAPAKRGCQSAAKAKKPRCRTTVKRSSGERSRGVEHGHYAPAVILDDVPAPRTGRVLEI
jgi:hypothetical protein